MHPFQKGLGWELGWKLRRAFFKLNRHHSVFPCCEFPLLQCTSASSSPRWPQMSWYFGVVNGVSSQWIVNNELQIELFRTLTARDDNLLFENFSSCRINDGITTRRYRVRFLTHEWMNECLSWVSSSGSCFVRSQPWVFCAKNCADWLYFVSYRGGSHAVVEKLSLLLD